MRRGRHDMQLDPNNWYSFGEIFGPEPRTLNDGTRVWQTGAGFLGCDLSALSLRRVEPASLSDDDCRTTREHVQLTLHAVDRSRVDGLSDGFSPVKLLKDAMFSVAGASYAYDLLARHRSVIWRSKGIICACLNLEMDRGYSRRTRLSRDEVDTAFKRGLLDDLRRARADFKLDMRPMLRKVRALLDSGHLPDTEWQVDVLFGHWQDESTGEFTQTPLGAGECLPDGLELRFTESLNRRRFRISDLFSEQRAR